MSNPGKGCFAEGVGASTDRTQCGMCVWECHSLLLRIQNWLNTPKGTGREGATLQPKSCSGKKNNIGFRCFRILSIFFWASYIPLKKSHPEWKSATSKWKKRRPITTNAKVASTPPKEMRRHHTGTEGSIPQEEGRNTSPHKKRIFSKVRNDIPTNRQTHIPHIKKKRCHMQKNISRSQRYPAHGKECPTKYKTCPIKTKKLFRTKKIVSMKHTQPCRLNHFMILLRDV